MFFKSLRTSFDFYKYLFFLKKSESISLLINIGIFTLSLLAFLSSLFNEGAIITSVNSIGLSLFLYSLFNIVWSLADRWKEISEFKGRNKDLTISSRNVMVRGENTYTLEDIEFEGIREWVYESYNPSDDESMRIIHSKDLNKYLWDKDLDLI